MFHRSILLCCFGLAGLQVSMGAAAQNAPGTDPVRLETKVIIQGLPNGPAPRSGNIGPPAEIPPWQRAKIARYEAKAFSGNRGNILTEKDVVNTNTTDGFKTTCTQSIGSNTTAPGITTGAGFKPSEQIVVLRGDLVNICN
jgi:hypothetical protein